MVKYRMYGGRNTSGLTKKNAHQDYDQNRKDKRQQHWTRQLYEAVVYDADVSNIKQATTNLKKYYQWSDSEISKEVVSCSNVRANRIYKKYNIEEWF